MKNHLECRKVDQQKEVIHALLSKESNDDKVITQNSNQLLGSRSSSSPSARAASTSTRTSRSSSSDQPRDNLISSFYHERAQQILDEKGGPHRTKVALLWLNLGAESGCKKSIQLIKELLDEGQAEVAMLAPLENTITKADEEENDNIMSEDDSDYNLDRDQSHVKLTPDGIILKSEER